ncbi:putative DNA primase subunit Pri1 [Myxozyma melibiosi]|uniref:DNA primase n=1 Tax=Myxozyma melibiosi TaxID=54550 RepID=A0ABR1F112_9ASCO
MPSFKTDDLSQCRDPTEASSPQSQSSVVQQFDGNIQTSSSPTPVAVKEDDMFGDEDDDDFEAAADALESKSSSAPSSSAPMVAPISTPPSKTAGLDASDMPIFYQRLMPFKEIFQWLNHFPSPTTSFTNREFAFTLQNDAYLRYQSFPTSDAFKKEVNRLLPSRFEIGPVYSANPRDRKIVRKTAFRPLEKELVFDIDMTDYDDVRTCCKGTDICSKCWNFITVAIRVIDQALREDFGFQHVLWVYSGRRGAHAWVCDKRARTLDDSKRRAVASYFEVLKGGAQSSKRVNLKRPLHPFVARSLNILRDSFKDTILIGQDPWRTQESAEKLLSLLPDRELNDALRKKWASSGDRSSLQKWADIDALAEQGVSRTLDPTHLLEAKQDVILEYLYPRLDAEVSKHLNHLLKSPFCVHPGTGRVCVPINGERPETFDPMDVPTAGMLTAEINEWDMVHKTLDSPEREKLSDYEKTSLKPYVEYFHRFVSGLMKEEMKQKRQREAESSGSLDF